MNANFQNLDRAFSLAHRASEDEMLKPQVRHLLRMIAKEIWLSLGADSQRLSEKRKYEEFLKLVPGMGSQEHIDQVKRIFEEELERD